MRDFFDSVLDFFFAILDFFHTIFEPVFGAASWGWSIIALTLLVRVLLLPLAIKQTRSMRAMQAIQPQIKELQKKYKVDRELMRKDPETYRARRQKLSEEQMALFKREGANPAASCLPLLAQAPIFIALFWMLQGQSGPEDPLFDAPFYFFTRFIDAGPGDPTGLAATVNAAGWPGWLLIVLMSGSMFITQRQMLARNAAMGTDNPMAQQQKILMYVMPVFLAFISFRFPLGILLYWVTTNVWQIAQQWIILREVQHEVETGELAEKPGGSAAAKGKKGKKGKKDETTGDAAPAPRRSPGASSGRKKVQPDEDDEAGASTPESPSTGGPKGKRNRKGKAAPKSASGGSSDDQAPAAGSPPAATGSGGSKDSTGSNGSNPGKGAAGAGSETGGETDGDLAGGNGDAAARPRTRDHLPRRRGGASS